MMATRSRSLASGLRTVPPRRSYARLLSRCGRNDELCHAGIRIALCRLQPERRRAMNRETALAIAMLFAGSAGIHAQQPQDKKSEPAHKTVLLSGCLGRATPESAFTLTNATTL